MKRALILLLISLTLSSVTYARFDMPQRDVPKVKWSMTVSHTSPQEGVVLITATPAAGWHLYGTEIPQGGPKATVIDLTTSQSVAFTSVPIPSVEPVSVQDPMFGIAITWWDVPVTFKVPFTIDDSGSPCIRVAITYMACNDETCSPPATVTLTQNISLYSNE